MYSKNINKTCDWKVKKIYLKMFDYQELLIYY